MSIEPIADNVVFQPTIQLRPERLARVSPYAMGIPRAIQIKKETIAHNPTVIGSN
jgi:hypothetical protein